MWTTWVRQINVDKGVNAKSLSCCQGVFEGESSENFAVAVLWCLKITLPDNMDPMTFLLEVLGGLNLKPTFIVEVDKIFRFRSKNLEELLMLLKRLRDDLQLIVPVVVLSSSRSALSLELSPASLRVAFFSITDLTENECRQFFQSVIDT